MAAYTAGFTAYELLEAVLAHLTPLELGTATLVLKIWEHPAREPSRLPNLKILASHEPTPKRLLPRNAELATMPPVESMWLRKDQFRPSRDSGVLHESGIRMTDVAAMVRKLVK